MCVFIIPNDFKNWQPLEKPLWGHNFIVIMISETEKCIEKYDEILLIVRILG